MQLVVRISGNRGIGEALLYKYDIPVGFPPGITSRPEIELSLEGVAHRDVIPVLLYRTKYKTQKGGKLQTPEILDKYSSSALLN